MTGIKVSFSKGFRVECDKPATLRFFHPKKYRGRTSWYPSQNGRGFSLKSDGWCNILPASQWNEFRGEMAEVDIGVTDETRDISPSLKDFQVGGKI